MEEPPSKDWDLWPPKQSYVYKFPPNTIPSHKTPWPPHTSGEEDPVAQLLAHRYYDLAVAHNERNLDITSHPWSLSTPNLKIEIAFGPPKEVGLEEYLEMGKGMYGGDAEARVEVFDVTVVRGGVKTARVFANQAVRGRGLCRRSVVIAEFWREGEEGEWLLGKVRHIKGCDGGGW